MLPVGMSNMAVSSINSMMASPTGPAYGSSQTQGTAAGTQQQSGIKFNFQEPRPIKPIEINPEQGYSSNVINGPTTWGHTMQQFVREVNDSQSTASDKVLDVLRGGKTTVHEAMISMEEAKISFHMLSEMRNKFVQSYQEIMRMQI